MCLDGSHGKHPPDGQQARWPKDWYPSTEMTFTWWREAPVQVSLSPESDLQPADWPHLPALFWTFWAETYCIETHDQIQKCTKWGKLWGHFVFCLFMRFLGYSDQIKSDCFFPRNQFIIRCFVISILEPKPLRSAIKKRMCSNQRYCYLTKKVIKNSVGHEDLLVTCVLSDLQITFNHQLSYFNSANIWYI